MAVATRQRIAQRRVKHEAPAHIDEPAHCRLGPAPLPSHTAAGYRLSRDCTCTAIRRIGGQSHAWCAHVRVTTVTSCGSSPPRV